MQKTLSFSTTAQTILSSKIQSYQAQDFMHLLCDSVPTTDKPENWEWEITNFNKALKGKRAVFPEVCKHYADPDSLAELTDAIEDSLLGSVCDVPKLLQELETLVRYDVTVSLEKKEELLQGTDAERIASILRFALMRPYQPMFHESPKVEQQFQGVEVPKPVKAFIGREQELREIENFLEEENLLFLTGVTGIGKRELVKQYVKLHRKEYVNCLYLRFHGSVMETIADMRYIDDQPNETVEQRFWRHFKLLSCLERDSLLVITGMDVLPEQNKGFDKLKELGCQILVTTALEMKREASLRVKTLSDLQELVALFESICPQQDSSDARKTDVLALILLAHGHTYAVKLLALTMQEGFDSAYSLSSQLVSYGGCPPVETMLEVENEGAYCCDSYTEVLKSLLKVQSLSEDARNLLMQFCLMPLTGIHKKRFAKWTGQVRELQGLIRLGWIQEDSDGILYMNGLVKDMVAEQLHPTTEKCKKMLSSMVLNSKQVQNPNASELIHCMGSVMQTLHGLDKTTLEYVSAFMEFIQRNGVNVRQMLLDELQKEDGNPTEKRIGVLFLEVQQLMMECTVAQMSNTSVTFGDKGNALLEELQSLMAVLDKSVVACLTAPCYMLIGIATMSRDVDSLIRLIRMKDSMMQASEAHLPSYVGDVLALYGVLDSLYERPELTAVFKELLETKLKDSVTHEDSEEYIASLCQLRSVAENVSQYESFVAYQEEMTRLARTIPMLYSVFRRADIAG